jgi:hypothetical protein
VTGEEEVEGMYILKTVPTTLSFEAVPFVPGSRAEYDNVVDKVKKMWTITAPHNVEEWLDFEKSACIPESDSVEDHLQKHPGAFYIPLVNELFGKFLTLDEMEVNDTNRTASKFLIRELPVAIAQPVVAWSNRESTLKIPPIARVLAAPAGTQPGLEAAMVEHTKPIQRKPNKPKQKNKSEAFLDLFSGFMQNGQGLTFPEYAAKMAAVSLSILIL